MHHFLQENVHNVAYLSLSLSLYIYIYKEREREVNGESKRAISLHPFLMHSTYVCTYTLVYMHIHTCASLVLGRLSVLMVYVFSVW